MASNIDRSGLEQFIGRLKQVSQLENGQLLQAIAEEGRAYAQVQYAGVEDVNVRTELSGTTASIVAEGEQVLYKEFGTGMVGQGTYAGLLPTQTFVFESPKGSGDTHKTEGWQYYYPNPKTKRNGGWFHDGRFHKGEVAGAHMWNTRMYLRDNMTRIVRERMLSK